MRLDVSRLTGGRTLTTHQFVTRDKVESLLDLSPADVFSVTVSATMVDEVVYLQVKVKGAVYAYCDMCGAPTTSACECVLDEELHASDDLFDRENGEYDIEPIIEEAIVISAPRSTLCRVDCKGMCPRCGANLNHKQCSCSTKEQQPDAEGSNPFSILQDLLTGGAKNGSTKM